MSFQFSQGDRPLAGYTIQRGVGRGGFGEVYYALSDGGKEVALKYLRDNPQVELRGVAHCLNLKSPYLVALHDVKQNAQGDHFVIMEYVGGPSLRDLMNTESHEPGHAQPGLGPQKAAFFLREIGKGLAYLHDRGIVHRDMKPGNIFYEDGYVKIGDYGLSKIMAASQHSGQTVSVGTVHYMAPEVGSGNYDRTIDIYALGVILYEMLMGRVPFSGATMGEVLMKHLTAQPAVDALPEPFPRVIRKALAKNPADRYQTVNEMVSEVFAAEALDKSVSAFEPASLTTFAARAAARVEAHGASEARNVATLGTGSSNVGQNVPPPVINPAEGPVGRFERIHDRVSARVDAVADRIDRSPIGRQVAQAGRQPTNWLERIMFALLATAGIAIGMTLLKGEGPTYGALLTAHIINVVTCVCVGSWLSFDRLKLQGTWLPRFVILAAGGLLLMPLSALSWEHLGFAESRWATVLLVSMLLCDWPGRFYAGRKGQVCLGSAFCAGLFCLIAGVVLTNGGGFSVAAIAAAASLAVQAIGGIWPLAADAPVPTARRAENRGRRTATPTPIGVSPGTGAVPHVPPSPAAPGGRTVATDVNAVMWRSNTVRSLWLLIAAVLMLATAMSFIAYGLLDLNDDESAGLILGGIVAGNYFLFALSCAAPRFKRGLWRGVFRKAIFFTGTAVSGACGAALGLFNLPEDAFFILLGCVIAGGIVSLFVWFVPVPPYAPPSARPRDDDETASGRWRARSYFITSAVFAAASACAVILVMALVRERDWDEVLPAAAAPLGATALGFLIAGISSRQRRRRDKVVKLSLPLRLIFDVDAQSNLSQLIERHMTTLGYTLDNKSDMLWSFIRGNWAHQFFAGDVRRWKTTLNVAAYVLETGGHRLTCYLDMDATFSTPKQEMLIALREELYELKALLGGRDVPQPQGREAGA